jgi:hypothetical protein
MNKIISNTRLIPAANPRKVNSSAIVFSISLRATAEALLRASRAENGPDGCRVGCLAEQQERSARLAQRPPISKRTTHPAVRSELCRAPTGPRSPIGPRSKDAGGLDSRQPLPAQGVGVAPDPISEIKTKIRLQFLCGFRFLYLFVVGTNASTAANSSVTISMTDGGHSIRLRCSRSPHRTSQSAER